MGANIELVERIHNEIQLQDQLNGVADSVDSLDSELRGTPVEMLKDITLDLLHPGDTTDASGNLLVPFLNNYRHLFLIKAVRNPDTKETIQKVFVKDTSCEKLNKLTDELSKQAEL